jgi:hypothetical protein
MTILKTSTAIAIRSPIIPDKDFVRWMYQYSHKTVGNSNQHINNPRAQLLGTCIAFASQMLTGAQIKACAKAVETDLGDALLIFLFQTSLDIGLRRFPSLATAEGHHNGRFVGCAVGIAYYIEHMDECGYLKMGPTASDSFLRQPTFLDRYVPGLVAPLVVMPPASNASKRRATQRDVTRIDMTLAVLTDATSSAPAAGTPAALGVEPSIDEVIQNWIGALPSKSEAARKRSAIELFIRP